MGIIGPRNVTIVLCCAAVLLAGCHGRSGKAPAALPSLQEQEPGNFSAYEHKIRADLFFHAGDYTAAVEEADKAVLADGRDGHLRATLALCLIATGELPEAKRQLDTALRLSPDSVDVWLARADYYVAMGDKPLADRCAWTAFSYDRTGVKALYWLIDFYWEDTPSKSEQLLAQVIAVDDSNGKVYLKQARIKARLNKHPQAVRSLVSYLERPGQIDAFVRIYLVERLALDGGEVLLEAARLYLDRQPLDDEMRSLLVDRLVGNGDRERALMNMKQIFRMNPTDDQRARVESWKRAIESASEQQADPAR